MFGISSPGLRSRLTVTGDQVAVPLCRVVARATLWWQAPRTVLVALAAYLSVWCLALQILPGRARVLAACAVTRPVRPDQGMRDATGWGVRAAGRCVTSCLVPMALTAVYPTPAAVGGVGALLLVERFSEPLPRGALVVPYIALGAVLISSTLS